MNFKEWSPEQVARYIDHTALKADLGKAAIRQLCEEALKHKFFAVCINSYWLPYASEVLKGSQVHLATVVGFPLGASSSYAKCQEAVRAIENGAREIDMVMNIGAAKDGDWKSVERDIHEVARASAGSLLKVILETCYLSTQEIEKASQVAIAAGAEFVKTSTGFGSAGAKVEDVELMRATVGPQNGVKASGGIRNWDDFKKMLEAGASRIGSSNSVKIIEEFKKQRSQNV